MISRIIFILFSVCFAGHLHSQNNLDFNLTYIKGNVKSIKTTGTTVDSNGKESISSRVWFNLYDQNQNDSISWFYENSLDLSEFEDSSVYIYEGETLKQIIIFNHRGVVHGNTYFEYDNQQLIKMWKKYNLSDLNTVEMEYKYGEENNYTRKLFFPLDSASYSIQTLNTYGMIISQSCFKNEILISTSTSSYNDFGLISKITTEYENNQENRVRTFEYEYDEKGNWIIKKEFEQGVLKFIWRKEIVYYN